MPVGLQDLTHLHTCSLCANSREGAFGTLQSELCWPSILTDPMRRHGEHKFLPTFIEISFMQADEIKTGFLHVQSKHNKGVG